MLVLIQWVDITGADGPWSDLEEAKELTPALMTSIGRVVVDREDSVVIASTWGSDGELGNLNCIPKSAVRGWIEVDEASKEVENEEKA